MKITRKGIVLAGGSGTRLNPVTLAKSKQLVPVYDKPMVYYPISTLMLAGIKDILLITTPNEQNSFKNLLGDGRKWGINISYEIQKKPEGIAQAFLIAEDFINNKPVCLILGDNLFHGDGLSSKLIKSSNNFKDATIFGYSVRDPERYGVISFDNSMKVIEINEKPSNPLSNYAVTGIYFYDTDVLEMAKSLKPSNRNELEITDLNNLYLKEGRLKVELMSRGMVWLDTGTFESLHEASVYVHTIQKRQGNMICCPEEIAFRSNWINKKELKALGENLKKSTYGKYLLDLN